MGPGVVAFSTTRLAGCSRGQYASFNINRYCGDDDSHIARNLELLCRLLAVTGDHIVMPHQTHGTRVACIDAEFLSLRQPERLAALEGVDAVMTRLPGVCIGVSTADCIPLLLYDRRRQVACAVHAGWRGTVSRIAEKAVAAMRRTFGSQPSDITAHIGPGISLDSFEVGQEVYDAFESAGFNMSAISRRYPEADAPRLTKWHIDLPECNRLQLVASGINPGSISLSGICTYKNHDTFFSARRLGISSGRIFNAILLTAEGPQRQGVSFAIANCKLQEG